MLAADIGVVNPQVTKLAGGRNTESFDVFRHCFELLVTVGDKVDWEKRSVVKQCVFVSSFAKEDQSLKSGVSFTGSGAVWQMLLTKTNFPQSPCNSGRNSTNRTLTFHLQKPERLCRIFTDHHKKIRNSIF